LNRFNQLADLELLLLNIQDSNVKAYAKEAIDAYLAGAYRASIVSIWIAVVYDLYQKIRYLAEQYDDKAAKQCFKDIEGIRNNPDKKQVSAWEREILKKSYEKIHMTTEIEYEHLDRIQKDRHRCAHPVLDSEGLLFQPSPELVRAHIRCAVENLLSLPAVMGKAAIEALDRDVESSYFPKDLDGVTKILLDRHLSHSEKYVLNLVYYSLKKIVFLENNNQEFIDRYILVFLSILKKRPHILEKTEVHHNIANIINQTSETRYEYLHTILFDYNYYTLYNLAEDTLKEKFKVFLEKEFRAHPGLLLAKKGCLKII